MRPHSRVDSPLSVLTSIGAQRACLVDRGGMSMNPLKVLPLILCAAGTIMAQQAADRVDNPPAGERSSQRLTREVPHELVMLPYYGVFDNLAYQVNAGTVTLMGQVRRPTLKSSAERVVKGIEGVERVENNIEV